MKGGENAVFSVEDSLGGEIVFEWVVSAGLITKGQGTPSIEVDLTGLPPNMPVIATVEAKGLPQSCPRTASCSVFAYGIIHYHDKIDEYGNIRFNDEKARLDNLAVTLLEWPDNKGYIIAYGGRVTRIGEARRRAERAKKYLIMKRGISSERIVTLDGGYRENLTVELRSRSKDTPAPEPVPTVDPSEVTFIKSKAKRKPRPR